MQTSCQKKCR